MKDTLVIGVVAKPQGVRGELKITPYTDDVNRFSTLKNVIIDGKTYSITKGRGCGSFAIISILGVNDRNMAETFRGKEVSVLRKDGAELKEDSYYIVDIIGCKLIDDNGSLLGQIVDVTSAKTDIFTVKTVDDKIMRFPFLKDLLVEVDVESQKVIVKKARLMEVSVYEN